jgi:hypothetical protein
MFNADFDQVEDFIGIDLPKVFCTVNLFINI